MSNKNIIEEKVDAIIEEMHEIEDLPVTEEQAWRMLRSALTKALTEVAAHQTNRIMYQRGYADGAAEQQARNIEAVGKEAYRRGIIAACDYIYDRINESIGGSPTYDVPSGSDLVDIIDAARSQHLSE